MDFDEMRNAYKRATEQDITDRLKSLIGANYATWDIDVDNAMQESIDEIERLRADRDRWHKIANELHLWLMPDFEDDEVGKAGVYAMQMYEQAVRGDR